MASSCPSSSSSYVEKYLEHYAANPVQSDYNLKVIRGIPQNPTFDEKKFEALIDGFETRADDVFVCTFVKAGTTWTQQLVHLLLRGGEKGGFYSETAPWLEALTSDMLAPREAPTWSMEKLGACSSAAPRYFKTHANVQHLPGCAVLFTGRSKERPLDCAAGKHIKVVYVARNPKDVCVSLFHHAKSKPEFGFTGSFDSFCHIFLNDQAENGSWFEHVLHWHRAAQADTEGKTVLFLQYEDMHNDTSEAVRKIAAFLELPGITDEVVAKVLQHSTIDEMRQNASIGFNHLRQGGYGAWRKTFSVATNELFDDVYRFRMQGSDLKFNFGPSSSGEDVIM